MGVGVNGLGHVVVDNEDDVFNIDASAGHVGSLGALLEPVVSTSEIRKSLSKKVRRYHSRLFLEFPHSEIVKHTSSGCNTMDSLSVT